MVGEFTKQRVGELEIWRDDTLAGVGIYPAFTNEVPEKDSSRKKNEGDKRKRKDSGAEGGEGLDNDSSDDFLADLLTASPPSYDTLPPK